MATCIWCNKDMMNPAVVGCSGNTVVKFPDDTSMDPVPYNPDYGGEDQRCHDCNVKKGHNHHPRCDMERCPKCQGQLIGCGCLDEEEDEDDDEEEP